MSDGDITARLSAGRAPFGYSYCEHIDELPGLYCFWLRGRCIYTGMSTNLKRRLRQHCYEAETNEELAEYFKVYSSEIEVSISYEDAPGYALKSMESRAIAELRPLTNRQGMMP